MTADEARLILNVKKEDSVERILQVRVLRLTWHTSVLTTGSDNALRTQQYEHLFKANSPPPPAKPSHGKQVQPVHSHYLQSKVVRAKERLDAELKAELAEGTAETTPPASESSSSTPPPPSS